MSIGAEIIELSRRIEQLELRRSRLVADFEASHECEQHGCPNTIAFLKSHCNLSASAAMEVRNVALRLPELPAVEAAARQGQIGFQQAAVIAESADRVGVESLFERQQELVERAQSSDPSALRHEVRRVELQVDAERARQESEWAYRSRRLQLKTLADGRVRLDGVLDPEGGAVVNTALNAALGPRAKEETRTEAQRRADAFVSVASRSLEGRRFGETGGQRPHVNITVELETLVGLRDEPARLNGKTPIVLDTVQRYLCDASVSMTALLEGQVVQAGKERRTFSGPLRRALSGRQPHCQHEGGCDRPVDWCEGHHLLAWVLGGQTSAANAQMLCRFHHRLAHSPPAA